MKYVLAALVTFSLIFTPAAVFAASADASTNSCASGDNSAAGQALQSASMTGDDCKGVGVTNIAQKIVSLLSWAIGIVAIVMVLIAGYKYITSAGDSNRIASAKNTLIYAIIGLAIVALAQVVVHFAISGTKGGLKRTSLINIPSQLE